jgi:hypothetical protein
MSQIEYACPICKGLHFLETGGEVQEVIDSFIEEQIVPRFALSVMEHAHQGVAGRMKEARAKSVGQRGYDARDVKRAAASIAEPLGRIASIFGGMPRMFGTLIIEHTDGKTTKLIAQSAGEELFEGTDVPAGFKHVHAYISSAELPSVFADRTIQHSRYLQQLSTEDFRTNCAATKLLCTVARDYAACRRGQSPTFLASGAPVATINLTEIQYNPFTEKMPAGLRDYTRSIDNHLARPCHRCELRVPAMICPVENVQDLPPRDYNVFPSAEEFVARWPRGWAGRRVAPLDEHRQWLRCKPDPPAPSAGDAPPPTANGIPAAPQFRRPVLPTGARQMPAARPGPSPPYPGAQAIPAAARKPV